MAMAMVGGGSACIFCQIARSSSTSTSTQLLYADEKVVAFPDINPSAYRHYLVIPVEHIGTVKDLQSRPDDYNLVSHMLSVGQSLLHRDAPEPRVYRFGFHQPPFNSVNHLHLHCLALPFMPRWRHLKYLSLGSLGGFLDAEKLLTTLKPPQVANLHYLVIPVEHIGTVKDLQSRPDDYNLVSHMLSVGQSLLHRDAPEPRVYRFGFHQPPFNSVNHLHLHCLALPFMPRWRHLKYLSLGSLGGFLDAEKLLTTLKPPQVANLHYLVIPVEHIGTVKDLQSRPDDYNLVSHMLSVGQSLLHRDAPEPRVYRFGFHQPPFNSVNHLHLHCLALPFMPRWRHLKYLSLGSLGGFLDAEKLLTTLKPPQVANL